MSTFWTEMKQVASFNFCKILGCDAESPREIFGSLGFNKDFFKFLEIKTIFLSYKVEMDRMVPLFVQNINKNSLFSCKWTILLYYDKKYL